jgi:hypothetical protein
MPQHIFQKHECMLSFFGRKRDKPRHHLARNMNNRKLRVRQAGDAGGS